MDRFSDFTGTAAPSGGRSTGRGHARSCPGRRGAGANAFVAATAILALAAHAGGVAGMGVVGIHAATAQESVPPTTDGVPAAASDSTPAVAPSAEAAALYRERLSRAFAQRGRNLLQRQLVFLGILESARSLIEEATRLAPDNPFIWRLAADLAAAMEDGDPKAEALLSTALRRLTELEPWNEVVRFRRLADAVSRKQTAEERIAAYRVLLTDGNIEKIGAPVAARLAFDLAILLRRTGDLDGFHRELIRAIDLDAAFPEATELAAGYFGARAPTPVEEARAMRLALLANPTREPAATGLAELCMRYGAYAAAAQILEIEAVLQETPLSDAGYDALVSQLVLAVWGAGDPQRALQFAQRRQESLNAALLAQVERQGTTLSLEERGRILLPATSVLSTTVAAVFSGVGLPNAAAPIASAAVSTQLEIDTIERALSEVPPGADGDARRAEANARVAELALEGAMVQAWLGGNLESARDWFDKANRLSPVSDDARRRFDGWMAARKGDAAAARELLAPLADDDLLARLGLAVLDEEAGDRQTAARAYLEVARAMPASAVGLWARSRLERILGKRVDIIAGAAEIEAAAALPADFVSLLRDGKGQLLLRLRPQRLDASPWDPFIFTVELTNRSAWPLAVTTEGPLSDTMTITSTVNIPGRRPSLPPFAIVGFEGLFAIPPGGSLTVPIDLSLTDASVALREDPIAGAFMSAHAIINWTTTTMGLEPGALGVEVESDVVHIEGRRVTAEWVAETVARLADATRAPDPELVALLSYALVRAKDPLSTLPDDARAALLGTPDLITDATHRLWPEARAWLVFNAPRGRAAQGGGAGDGAVATDILAVEPAAVPELEPMLAILRADESAATRMAWIAARVRRPEDPILAETEALADARLADFARDFRSWMDDVQAERRRELNLGP